MEQIPFPDRGTLAGTRRHQEIIMEQNPFAEKREEKRVKKVLYGDKPRNPSQNQKDPENYDGTKPVSGKNWEPHSTPELFGEKLNQHSHSHHFV